MLLGDGLFYWDWGGGIPGRAATSAELYSHFWYGQRCGILYADAMYAVVQFQRTKQVRTVRRIELRGQQMGKQAGDALKGYKRMLHELMYGDGTTNPLAPFPSSKP